jgi:hypothetical protein
MSRRKREDPWRYEAAIAEVESLIAQIESGELALGQAWLGEGREESAAQLQKDPGRQGLINTLLLSVCYLLRDPSCAFLAKRPLPECANGQLVPLAYAGPGLLRRCCSGAWASA